jgi:hypothetical protein
MPMVDEPQEILRQRGRKSASDRLHAWASDPDVALIVTVLADACLALGTFTLSFDALRELALAAGLRSELVWIWPLVGTGVRIGEALGIRRAVVDVDHGVIEINAKATFRKGRGGVLEERTKSDPGGRVIAVPGHVIDLCVRRMAMSWPPTNTACCSRGATAVCGYRATPTVPCARCSTGSVSSGRSPTRSGRRW